MAIDGASRQSRPSGPDPCRAAAGGGGITAATLQDQALGWAIVIGFIAWLIPDAVIALTTGSGTGGRQ